MRALQHANLLRSRCEVFAWVLAAAGNVQAAAQLIGAGDTFAQGSETQRDPISRLARQRADELVRSALDGDDCAYWFAQGSTADEGQLLLLLERAFMIHPDQSDPEKSSP